ncbi:IKI3 family-domain-containing protein [Blastocladiella britannica]|nr:IKI3 family-domain-containing protein [Blastocladiella britannica]
MKSLVLVSEAALDIACTDAPPPSAVLALAVDPLSNRAFVAVLIEDLALVSVVAVSLATKSTVELATIDVPAWPLADSLLDAAAIVSLHYLPDTDSLFLAFAAGEMLSVPVSNAPAQASPIGTIDAGLSAAEWSPDEELLVLVTLAGQALVMTRDYDVLAEHAIETDAHGAAVPVSVGWGKKETQFHGSAGKHAAQAAANTQAVGLSPHDDGAARVAWTGDGSSFAISTVDTSGAAKRTVRTYARGGTHLATSEPVNMLEHPLAWRPTGNLMAATQRAPGGRHLVVFFEPNGLRHGEFALPWTATSADTTEGTPVVVVREVCWNADSSALFVWASRTSSAQDQANDVVQVWAMNNYHWYLKQEIDLGVPFAAVHWDPVQPLTLHAVSVAAEYSQWRWAWDVIRNEQRYNNSHGGTAHAAAVGVVDGPALLHTPFVLANVPPPYSLSKLTPYDATIATPVKAAAFCLHPAHPERTLVVRGWASQLIMDVYDATDGKGRKMAAIASFSIQLPGISLRQPQFIDANAVIALGYDRTAHRDQLLHILFSKGTDASVVVTTTPIDFDASRIAASWIRDPSQPIYDHEESGEVDHDDNSSFGDAVSQPPLVVVVQDTHGAVWQATADDHAHFDLQEQWSFPTACDWLAVSPSVDPEMYAYLVVGLTSRAKLMVGAPEMAQPALLSAECSSFVVHAAYLIYTKLSHVAAFVPMADLPLRCASLVLPTSSVPPTTGVPSSAEERQPLTRAVERGAQIVTVHPSTSGGLVLQMPRGNLETVYPRPLILDAIVANMRAGDWKGAFALVWSHRVEMNVLVDTDMARFMGAVPQVIDQLGRPDRVNVLLSSLTEADVVADRFPWLDFKGRPAATGPAAVGNAGTKVARVCNAVRAALEARDDCDDWITTRITTHVKSSPPDVEAALRLVKSMASTPATAAAAEKALKYTIFLVDVDTLYDVALGMYDFALVLMVAQKSHKDPREYLPFLQSMRALPEPYRFYAIDAHLKRPVRALAHLLRSGDKHFAEVRQYAAHHNLYPQAIAHYAHDPANREKLRTVLDEYGQRLAGAGQHADAAAVFAMGEHWAQAQEEYQSAGDWRRVFAVAATRRAMVHDLSREQQPTRAAESTAWDDIGGGGGQEDNDDDADTDAGRLAHRIARDLASRTEHLAAATVLLDYAGDIEGAMAQWVAGGAWAEAMRVAHLHNRADLVDTHVRPGALAAATALLAQMTEMRGDLDTRVDRLVECRAEKAAKLDAIALGTGAHDPSLTNVDALSDTTSMMSTFTGLTMASGATSTLSGRSSKSNRSGKSRRKNERKRHTGKKGSVYEEEYLLDSSRRLLERIAALAVADVSPLLHALLSFGALAEATRVQIAYAELLDHCAARSAPVFTPEPPHPLQAQVDRFRMVSDEGLSEQQAETRLQEMAARNAAAASTPVKMPELSDWMVAVLPLTADAVV